MSISIPPFDYGRFTEENGFLTDIWESNLMQMYQAMQRLVLPFNPQSITTNTQMMTNFNYIVTSPSSINLTLPTEAQAGDTLGIIGTGNGWVLNQNAGQSILINNHFTTVGTGGSITSALPGDCLFLYCYADNTNFVVSSFSPVITNFTVV